MTNSVGITCPQCRHANVAGAKFCNQCGAALPSSSGSIERHESERRLGTVLFADIKGSTEIVARLDAETAKARLAPALDAMRAAVIEHGGNLTHVQGDGVMASFGIVTPLEDHALAACRAALQIRQQMRDAGGLAVRIGINSGEVVLSRTAGHALELSGPMIHLANRLEQAADPNTIFISNSTLLATRPFCTCRSRGRLSFKGFDTPEETWELLDAQSNSRWQMRSARGLAPFVGRDAETAALTSMLRAVAERPAMQTACILGDAGSGKSRLLHEVLKLATADRYTVWQASTEFASRNSPYAPIRQLLRQWLGLGGQDPAAAVARQLGLAIERAPEELAPHRHALYALLNLPLPDAADHGDPQRRQSEFARAFVAVCRLQSGALPLILVQEDLQWCDGETLELLAALIEELRDKNICLFATLRSESDGAAVKMPPFGLRLELSEFSAEEAAAFLDRTLGNDRSVGSLKQYLLDLQERLPFYLDETVKFLAAKGDLHGEPGNYVWSGSQSGIEAPPDVQAVAIARINGLSAPLRRVVLIAAAIGRRFPSALLAQCADLDDAGARTSIELLADEHILVLYDGALASECEFRHEFLREAAYSMLLRADRTDIHRKILSSAEILFGDRLSDWLGFLAHHAALAGAHEQTARYNRLAAEKAVESAAYAAALQYCERALQALEALPPTVENQVAIIDIKLLLRVAVGATSDFGPWFRHLADAIRIAGEIDDVPRRTLATIHRTWALNFAGSAIEAVQSGESALQLTAALRLPDMEALARVALGQAAYANGDFAKAVSVLTPAIQWLADGRETKRLTTTGTTLVVCLMMRATAHASLGRFAPAAQDLAQMESLAARTGLAYDRVALHYGQGLVLTYRGEIAQGVQTLATGYDICRQAEIRLFLPLIAALLGTTLIAAGRIEQANTVLDEALQAAEAVGHGIARTAAIAAKAALALAQRQPHDALRLAGEARSMAHARGHRGVEITAARVMAQSFSALDATDLVRPFEVLSAAIALADASGAAPALLSCLRARGQLALQHKQTERGIADLERAAALCEELGLAAQRDAFRQAIAAARSAGAGN